MLVALTDTGDISSGRAGVTSSEVLNPRSLEAALAMARGAGRELLEGMTLISTLPHPPVMVFSGARMRNAEPRHKEHCRLAFEVGKSLIESGLGVMTGGGPGGMHYTSLGAHFARRQLDFGPDVPEVTGIRIKLEFEPTPSPWLDKSFLCKYFFTRKVLMGKYSPGGIMLPGGMGSLDEYFEIVKLAATSRNPFPMVMLGRDYWQGLHDWLKYHPEGPGQRGYIAPDVLDKIQITDSPREAVEYVKREGQQRIERFYRYVQQGNLGPLAPDLVGDSHSVEQLLRHPQWKKSDVTQVWDAVQDLSAALRFLAGVDRALVAVVGARGAAADDPYRGVAREAGAAIGTRGLGVLLPGTRGLMGEVAAGVKESGDGAAYGIHRSRDGQLSGADESIHQLHHCFSDFVQRVTLTRGSIGLVMAPSGIGGLDTACEVQNLINCHKVGEKGKAYPVAYLGSGYWNSFVDVLRGFAERGYISHKEIDAMFVTDDPRAALRHILNSPRARARMFEVERRVALPVFS
jgi:uncharacterized protein (TIGR00730 family)